MASRVAPRSVRDATRFTSTIPHATSRAAGPLGGTIPAVEVTQSSPKSAGETPEQRVRRLRQAHIAAQRAQVSRTDRYIDASRKVLDVAHRWIILGIVTFTVVAGVVSMYSVWDMLQYNRSRRAEWIEAQRRIENDTLASARLAYVKGEATESQILLVEEATRQAEKEGTKLPPLLSPPEHRTHFEEHINPTFQGARLSGEGKGILGIVTGMFGGLKDSNSAASSDGLAQASEAAVTRLTDSMEAKAKNAWQAEMKNQQKGSSLDQLGLDGGGEKQLPSSRKWWWPW